jgi:GNAT superfamily N-acetyltransferase
VEQGGVHAEHGTPVPVARGSPCAAYVSGVPTASVRDADGPEDLAAVAALAAAADRPVAVDLLRELVRARGFVAVALDGSTVVGGSVAFLSPLGLHSWVTAVDPGHRRRGVATALKWHQREWALAEGLGAVTWTFAPGDGAAARLTVSRLRAEVTGYDRSTLRCEATWALRSAPVTRAWHGLDPEPVEPEHRCRPGEELAVAIEGGAYVVDVEADGAWLLRGPG